MMQIPFQFGIKDLTISLIQFSFHSFPLRIIKYLVTFVTLPNKEKCLFIIAPVNQQVYLSCCMQIYGGAYPIASVLGHKYFLTLVDDYSSFTWVILMKNKDETQPLIFLLTLKMFHFKVCFRPMNVLGQPWSCVSYPSSSEVVWMFGTYLLSLSNFQAWPMWYTWSSLWGDITRLSI